MPEPRSRVRSTRLRGYRARIAQLSEAFNLPDDLEEFVTLSMRGGDVQVKVGGVAGQTATSIDVPVTGALRDALKSILAANREDLHVALKHDLAVNMLAGMTDPGGSDD